MFERVFRSFFYPYWLLFDRQTLFVRKKQRFFFLCIIVGEFLFHLVLWILFWVALSIFSHRIYQVAGKQIGFVPVPVFISGTGSMYPTFPKGKTETPQEQAQEIVAESLMRVYPGGFTLFGKTYFSYTLKRFDIVSFSNQKTKEIIQQDHINQELHGFVKRIIGLAGDQIEIRDGFVYVNEELITEPYIASARSTFGGNFLSDCTLITVPDNQVFVLGDNRKASNDSRYDLGFVHLSDITEVLPFQEQTVYKSLWRDTSQDNELAQTPTLNTQEYLRKLNDIRVSHSLKPLVLETTLNQTATLRAQVMLTYNDLSFEATKSGTTMRQAMDQIGYKNTIWGEAPTLGYYTADELLDNYSQQPAWEKFLLDPRYQETGIAAVVGTINQCPTQLIVQHVAGYIPPNYSQEELQSWLNAETTLNTLLESWKGARKMGEIYTASKNDYERMISLIEERMRIVQIISARIKANEWFTDSDKQAIEQDKALAEEQNILANMLNEKVKHSF